MERAAIIAALAGALCIAAADSADAQTLRGSPQAMKRQNRIAQEHDYTFMQTSAQVRRFVELGLLERVTSTDDYLLASVSHPYARPAVKLFIERLASQYREACGERLVITSLTRPVREQPRNASHLSVHPAGMAVDLRVPGKASCRSWLERTLMSLERQGVLDAIRENRPPHYHVALFPEPYERYVARVGGGRPTTQLASAGDRKTEPKPEAPVLVTGNPPPSGELETEPAAGAELIAATLEKAPEAVTQYRVNRGDTLWSIARRHGTTVEALRRLNGIGASNRIVVGQRLRVPSRAEAS